MLCGQHLHMATAKLCLCCCKQVHHKSRLTDLPSGCILANYMKNLDIINALVEYL